MYFNSNIHNVYAFKLSKYVMSEVHKIRLVLVVNQKAELFRLF